MNEKQRKSQPITAKFAMKNGGSELSGPNTYTDGMESFLSQPDMLASAQYLETIRNRLELEPEKKLMLAVLDDAITCFRNNVFARDKKKRVLFMEAEQWILEEGAGYFLSFDNICDAFDIDPRYLRHGLMSWKREQMARHAA